MMQLPGPVFNATLFGLPDCTIQSLQRCTLVARCYRVLIPLVNFMLVTWATLTPGTPYGKASSGLELFVEKRRKNTSRMAFDPDFHWTIHGNPRETKWRARLAFDRQFLGGTHDCDDIGHTV